MVGCFRIDMRLEWEDGFVEPAIERQIIPAATQERHGNVCVRVVECRHQELSATIDHAIEGALWLRKLKMRDRAVCHAHIGMRNGLSFFGQDRDVFEEQ